MNPGVYVLERFNWRKGRGQWLNLPGADHIRSFVDRADADARCREMEWDLRRRVNPFSCGGPFLHYQTSFDAARLFDWCLDANLEPPGLTNDSRVWADWWATHHEKMTDAQRASVWEALDRVRFYRVSETEANLACHLVATQHFEEDPFGSVRDYGNYRYVGSTPYLLARSSTLADELCRQLFIEATARAGSYASSVVTPASWVPVEEEPFVHGDDGGERADWDWWDSAEANVEHRPVELFHHGNVRSAQDVFVVLRRHWRLESSEVGFWRWSPTRAKSCGRPVAAFNTLAAADQLQAKLEAEARRTPALFRFGPPHEWSNVHSTAIFGVLSEIAPVNFTSLWTDYTAPDEVWCRWWDEFSPTMTIEQSHTVWSLYDRLKFYEIVAVEYRE